MPLVSGRSVEIDFVGRAESVIAASNATIKAVEAAKKATVANSKELEAAAKREQAAIEKTAKAAEAAAKKQELTFGKLSVGIGIAAVAMKKAFEFAKEGAQIEFVRQKFDNLSASIGTTSEALLGDLKTATKGMYSDMELVASATDFVGLGLANTHDEAVRLAAVSSGLNMNMNQLVLTLTNMTTMRFDALGVRVDGFKERVDKLKESGLSADAAFKEAFLQQAEAQLLLVGNAADTTAGQFMTLEANIKNASDGAKIAASTSFAPIVKKLNEVSDATTRTRENTELYNEYMVKTNGTLVLSRSQFNMMHDDIDRVANTMKRGAAMTEFYSQALDDNSETIDENSASVEENAEAMKESAKSNSDFLSLLDKMQSRTEDFTEKNDELMEKFHELRDAQSEYTAGSDEYNELGEQINEVSGEIGELGSAYEAAGKKIAFELVTMKAASDGWQAGEFENLLALGEQWGIYDASVVAAASAMETSAQRMTDSLGAPISKTQTMIDKVKILERLNGLAFDFYVSIHTKGSIPAALGDVGLGEAAVVYNNPDTGNETGENAGGVDTQASGGKLGKGWTLVGDMPGGRLAAYSELIGPDGTVYNAKDTRALMASGRLGSVRSMAEPNESGGSGGVIIPYIPSSPGGAGGGQGGGNNVGNNSPSSISSIVSQLEAGQENTQQEVAGLSSAIQLQAQQTAQLLNMTTQMNGYLSTLVSLAKTNPRAVGKNVAFEFAKST